MIIKSHSIATVEEPPLEKWLPARILTAKGSGSIFPAFKRRIYLRSGTAWTARSRGIKQETRCLGGTSLTRKMLMLDMTPDIMTIISSSFLRVLRIRHFKMNHHLLSHALGSSALPLANIF
jgi:hypothetical protein